MKEFTVSAAKGAQYVRMVVGGRIGSGKTTFASSAPTPVFISDMVEGSYKVIANMAKRDDERALWWDPNVEPYIMGCETMGDIPQAITKLQTMAASGKMPWKTLVFDSLSIYGQRVLRELKAGGGHSDGRQRYGELADAVALHVARIHALPMHVLWLCHVDDEFNLAIPGKATAATWANMDYKVLTYAETSGKSADWLLHTQPFRGANWLGGRGGIKVKLPDPMVPSFKCVAQIIGLPEKPVSPACPTTFGQEFPFGVDYAI